MILEAIGDYLNGKEGLVQATNLFLAKMPDSPDVCTTVYEYEGVPPIETFGPVAYEIDKPRIQVVCRAARDDYAAARDKINAIRALLGALTNVTISNTKILRVASTGSSFPLGLDDRDRPRISTNFQVFVGR